jgi:hypothetical protein
MALGHERLDDYRLVIGYVAWVYGKADGLTGSHRSTKDQWLRECGIPIITTEAGARATVAAIRYMRHHDWDVQPLQDYYA